MCIHAYISPNHAYTGTKTYPLVYATAINGQASLYLDLNIYIYIYVFV